MNIQDIPDELIYRYYLGDVRVGDMYCSPIPAKTRGKEDLNASFGLVELNGRVVWKDFGYADASGNKAINLVMEMEGVSFKDALDIVESEIMNWTKDKPFYHDKLKRRKFAKSLPFLRYRKKLLPFELEYWDRFDLTQADLTKEQIYGLVDLTWIGGKSEKVISRPGDPGFVYWFQDNPVSWKLYRPLAKPTTVRDKDNNIVEIPNKFRQHNISGVIEGYHDLPWLADKDGTLIITASTKDRAVIKKAGYYSINPTGEASYRTLAEEANKIEKRGFKPIIMYDADEPGFNGACKLSSYTQWDFVDMRGRLEGWKDFSDYIDREKGNFSYVNLVNLINKLLNGKRYK